MKNSLLNLIALLLPLVFLTGQEKQQPPKGGTPKNFSLPEKETIAFDNGLELVLIPVSYTHLTLPTIYSV